MKNKMIFLSSVLYGAGIFMLGITNNWVLGFIVLIASDILLSETIKGAKYHQSLFLFVIILIYGVIKSYFNASINDITCSLIVLFGILLFFRCNKLFEGMVFTNRQIRIG